MSDDSDRIRAMQERLAEIRQENEAADALADRRRAERAATPSPVQPARRRGWPFVVAVLIAGLLLGELALTLRGMSSPDFGDARRLGKATVVSCERKGPVGLGGFGYWDLCTADVVWDGGFSGRYTFDQRNFLHADEIGTTVTIGENPASRGGGVSYSRPEAPHRPVVVAIGAVLGVIAVLPLLVLVGATIHGLRRRLRRR